MIGDGTPNSCIGSQILNHWTTRKSLPPCDFVSLKCRVPFHMLINHLDICSGERFAGGFSWERKVIHTEGTGMHQINEVRYMVFSLFDLGFTNLLGTVQFLNLTWPFGGQLLLQIFFLPSIFSTVRYSYRRYIYIYRRKIQEVANWPLQLNDRLYDSLWSEIRKDIEVWTI